MLQGDPILLLQGDPTALRFPGIWNRNLRLASRLQRKLSSLSRGSGGAWRASGGSGGPAGPSLAAAGLLEPPAPLTAGLDRQGRPPGAGL